MMTTHQLPGAGLVAVAVTPFDDNGGLDCSSAATLLDFYVRAGVSGIALLGVQGEANRMTDAEAHQALEVMLDALAGRVPAVVGVSDPSLERLIDRAQVAMAAGAAGVMVQPLAGVAGDEAVAAYFQQVTRALGSDVPVCVQDFPKASGVHLSVGAWRRIVDTCPSVVMLKHEDEPGLGKLSAIRRAEADGLRRVTILSGNNGISLPQELARGADGAMTGFAFPDVLAMVCTLTGQRLADEAEDLFDAYLPLNRHELRTGIAVRKEILRRRGVISTATARYPVRPLGEVDRAELDHLLARLERRVQRSCRHLVTEVAA